MGQVSHNNQLGPVARQLLAASMLSGIVSGLTLMTSPLTLWAGPGALFGIATGSVFVAKKWLDPVRAVIWVILSTGAWFLAIESYVSHASGPGTSDSIQLYNMLASGALGAIIIALAFSLLVRKASPVGIVVTIASGCALAAPMNWIIASGSGADSGPAGFAKMAAAFAIWQVGIGVTLLAYKPKSSR
jgi:hypothetical protein